MDDDSNSWDNAIDDILNSADDLSPLALTANGPLQHNLPLSTHVDPASGQRGSNSFGVSEPPSTALGHNPLSTVPVPSTDTCIPSPGSHHHDDAYVPIKTGVEGADAGPPLSLFSHANTWEAEPSSLFGSVPSAKRQSPPRPPSFISQGSQPTSVHSLFNQSAPPSGPLQDKPTQDHDDVLGLLDSPVTQVPRSIPSTHDIVAPSSSKPDFKPTLASVASDQDDMVLPDFLQGLGGGGGGSVGDTGRQRRRRLLNIAQMHLGSPKREDIAQNDVTGLPTPSSKSKSATNPLSFLDNPKSTLVAHLSASAEVENKIVPYLVKNDTVPSGINKVAESGPRDPLEGLLKPRYKSTGVVAITPDSDPPIGSKRLSNGSPARDARDTRNGDRLLPFLSGLPPKPATQVSLVNTTQHVGDHLPADATPVRHIVMTDPAIKDRLAELEKQVAMLTSERDTLRIDQESMRARLTDTETLLATTQSQLVEAQRALCQVECQATTTKDLDALRIQLTEATRAVTQREEQAQTMHDAAISALKTQVAHVAERERQLEECERVLAADRAAVVAERTQAARVAEEAAGALARAMERESQVVRWAETETERVRAERLAIDEARKQMESDLATQRVHVQGMQNQVDADRMAFIRSMEEERRVLATAQSAVQTARQALENDVRDMERTRDAAERAAAEAMRDVAKEGALLTRRAERVARDEGRAAVALHRMQVVEAKLAAEREALDERSRDVARVLEEARETLNKSTCERREAVRLHREVDKWRRTGREELDAERMRLRDEWNSVCGQRQRWEIQVADLAKRALSEGPPLFLEAWTPAMPLVSGPPSPVSPGQNLGSGDWDLEDCQPKVNYIPRRFHPSDVSIGSGSSGRCSRLTMAL